MKKESENNESINFSKAYNIFFRFLLVGFIIYEWCNHEDIETSLEDWRKLSSGINGIYSTVMLILFAFVIFVIVTLYIEELMEKRKRLRNIKRIKAARLKKADSKQD